MDRAIDEDCHIMTCWARGDDKKYPTGNETSSGQEHLVPQLCFSRLMYFVKISHLVWAPLPATAFRYCSPNCYWRNS